MVQPIDFNKPVYSAVNISIKKPEINAGANGTNDTNKIDETNSYVTNPMDNGIYNAVKIDIDNPRINREPQQQIYDYPEAEGIVTYEMLNINPVAIPEKPEENIEDVIEIEEVEEPEKYIPEETSKEINEETFAPEPNFTTVDAEKDIIDNNEEKKTPDVTTSISFRGNETVNKKPEIIPSENILPKIDIELVTDNLKSENKDIQAQQIEEIVRTAILDKETAKHYLVSDVFTNLINISEQDVTKLPAPTKQQIEARQKLIANIIAVEKDNKTVDNLPYKMSDEEIAIATNLSPMELAERNKEYAITALGALAELFIEDYEAKEGRIVPITDAPGVSAIVNALRKDPDPSVKLAAIDSLRHIRRPEYKEELSALFTLAQTDSNPYVAKAAAISLQDFDKK